MTTMHGTAVSRLDVGVLILGQSGSGKSQLGLSLMALGASLIADDGVVLAKEGQDVILRCPAAIKGKIEARGVGLLSVKPIEQARLAFVVDMDKTAATRLPRPKTISILGEDFPLIEGKDGLGLSAVLWCLLGGGQILPTD